jgi:DMSO/TMAO reductase YedYZ molybdopterin-dependent catalytic subunit
MPGPRGRNTNLALLGLMPLALVTGGLAFLLGSGPVRPVAVAHGVVGLAILVLAPWKSAVARRGLRRRRAHRWLSLVLTMLVVLALLSGLAHSSGLLRQAFGLTAIQVHVGAALLAAVPVLLHVRRRPVRAGRRDLSRRSLLRAGLLAGSAGSLYAASEGAASVLALPGATRRSTGSYEVRGGPAAMPVTSWLFDAVPALDAGAWRLEVGSGGQGRSWTLADLTRVEDRADRAVAVLDCTGGWWSGQEWSGVAVSRLLPGGASGSVQVTSSTGYRRRLPLTDDLLLAFAVGGRPLTAGHGGPARLVVPGRRGYHWVKWVVRIEHDSRPWWAEPPFPLR